MGFIVLRCFEYVAECDMCGIMVDDGGTTIDEEEYE